ncbi:MAG: (d)CMP kinase [Fibrobacterota bacterium]
MIVTIDGPAGSGKSSTSAEVARTTGFKHLDTGAMYRAITLKALQEDIPSRHESALEHCMKNTTISFQFQDGENRVFLDNQDVTKKIRSHRVSRSVSEYSAVTVVRDALVMQQRTIGHNNDIVCEGRDMGTVVFPDAELKFFLTASVEERARRRLREMDDKNMSLQEMIADIENRDRADSSRAVSPLKEAEDAIRIDTTLLNFTEQVNMITDIIRDKCTV